MITCDDCGKSFDNKYIYTTSMHIPTFECTITDIHLCKRCFKNAKGKEKV